MNDQQLDQLNTLLKQGILLLESLSKTYDTELETLGAADLDAFSDITQVKTKQLEEFHAFTQERIELLTSFGAPAEAGNYELDEKTPNSPAATSITETTSQLKALLTELQTKNKRNEQAIHRNQQNVTQFLDILRGQKRQDQLYNQKGSAGLYKAQSRLGKA